MAQHPHVPKFGNWEIEDNVPYTVYFDKARKGKIGGKMINPNDPEENPDMFPNIAPPAQAPPSPIRNEPEEPIGRAVRPTDERRVSKEDGDPTQFTESPARKDNMGRGAASGPTHQRRGGHGSGSGRPVRQSAGSENSIERSPLHPHYQAKITGKGSGSPAREGKNSYDSGHGKNSNDSSHGTPGRSRMKPVVRGDESPDRGAAVPRFGAWEEDDPSSAENYTYIFNKVREQRHTGSPKVSGMDTEQSYMNKQKQSAPENNKCCCFPWGRK